MNILRKKLIIFSILGLSILFIIFFAKLGMMTSQQQDTLKDLQEQLSKIRIENSQLKEQLSEQIEELKTIKDNEQEKDILITDFVIKSNDKNEDDRIYGTFDVSAKIKNNSNNDIKDCKVALVFVTSIPGYSKDIRTENKMLTIPVLKTGQETETIFENIQVNHPETLQEVIVAIMDTNNNVGDVKKVRIRAAFPPDSQD